MSALLSDLQVVCQQLIPILIAVVLVVCAYALYKLAGVFSACIDTLYSLKGSVKLVEKSLDKAQAPLDSVVKISKSIDGATDSVVAFAQDTKNSLKNRSNKEE